MTGRWGAPSVAPSGSPAFIIILASLFQLQIRVFDVENLKAPTCEVSEQGEENPPLLPKSSGSIPHWEESNTSKPS